MKHPNNPQITVIIPVFNEEAIIQNTLKQFKNYFDIEVLVVDGKSTDRTKEIVTQFSLNNKQIHLITSSKLSRATQMNYGAELATGDILLFLHADTILPNNFQLLIQYILQKKNIILGAFKLVINGQKKSLRLVEKMVNLRSRWLSLPYGDQGFFITKDNFNRLGGFTDLPIMEDFNFVQRAKRQGEIAIANAAVITSARRWQKLGVIRTTIINQLIIIGYYLKIHPDKLRAFYRSFNTKNT
ncbi:TIGR04283 family arsenosugar biosynthesis glycosyltransferase [Hyella patelloides]|nr:TIGR04283 family arsenosugar biosynthesis glycosyltransferase [Hyella patelloides]